MSIEEMVEMLRYLRSENRRVTREDDSVLCPVFVFTLPDELPKLELNAKPEWMSAIPTFDEACPVFVVVSNNTAETLYTNLLRQHNVLGFVYVVNVNQIGQRSAITSALFLSDLNILMYTFTSWDATYIPTDLDACLVCREKPVVAVSVANDGESRQGSFLNYTMPTSTIVYDYKRIKATLKSTTVFPFYESAFTLQFLLWLADRGLDFVIYQDDKAIKTEVADYITADTLHKLHTERPFIFTKNGTINVKYIHDLALESAKLIYGGK